jgi:branched-chain amino acid transport system ATP-binding protein
MTFSLTTSTHRKGQTHSHSSRQTVADAEGRQRRRPPLRVLPFGAPKEVRLADDTRRDGQPILEIEGLNKHFGGLHAVSDFSLRLEEGELKGLIGPNGAGKTTVFHLITGYHKPDSGRIAFRGINITGHSPDRVTKLGIARTFQKIRMLGNIKVIDAMKTAFYLQTNYNALDVLLQTPKYTREERRIEGKALELLDFFGIAHLANEMGTDLAYGLQRRVSFARALALKPELLLLDEPTAGLNPAETDEIVELFLKVREQFNLSIILVEHDMRVIMGKGVCDSVVVIGQGAVITEGTCEEIQQDERVIEAYLGAGVVS